MKMKTTKLTNLEVVQATIVLNLPEVTKNLDDLTVKEKLRVNRIFDALITAYNEYEKQRVALVDEYAERDENGKMVTVENESGSQGAKFSEDSKFHEEVKALQEAENPTEFPVLSYGSLGNTKLPFSFIRAFSKVFTE
jgi:hypothetical protein